MEQRTKYIDLRNILQKKPSQLLQTRQCKIAAQGLGCRLATGSVVKSLAYLSLARLGLVDQKSRETGLVS